MFLTSPFIEQAIAQVTRNGIRQQAFVCWSILRHQFGEPLIDRFHRLCQIVNRSGALPARRYVSCTQRQ